MGWCIAYAIAILFIDTFYYLLYDNTMIALTIYTFSRIDLGIGQILLLIAAFVVGFIITALLGAGIIFLVKKIALLLTRPKNEYFTDE